MTDFNPRSRRRWGPVATFTERPQLAITTGPQQALVVAELARREDVTAKAAALRQTIAVLAGHMALWEARGQLGALDGYLSAVAYRRQSGTLPQYREFNDAVKAAALILRQARAIPIDPPPPAAANEDPPAPALYRLDSATGTLVLTPVPGDDPAAARTDMPPVAGTPWGDLSDPAREHLATWMTEMDAEAARAATDPLRVGEWKNRNGGCPS